MPVARETMWPGRVLAAQWSEASLGLDPSPDAHELGELSPVIYHLEASNFLIYKTASYVPRRLGKRE